MPISPFGAALRLPSTAVAIAGALLCFVLGSWLLIAAGVFRSPAPHETRPPMTLRDRPMRRESLLSEKKLA